MFNKSAKARASVLSSRVIWIVGMLTLKAAPAFASTGTPFLREMLENTPAARKTLADDLAHDFADLIASKDPRHQTLREIVLTSIRAVRVGADRICKPADRMTVYRGHGLLPILIAGPEQRNQFILAQSLYGQIMDPKQPLPIQEVALVDGAWSGVGDRWEDMILKRPDLMQTPIDLVGVVKDFVTKSQIHLSPGPKNRDSYDFAQIEELHSKDSRTSPMISTSLNPVIALNFDLPVIEAEVCPGRMLPAIHTGFVDEAELEVFGFLLPEEIKRVYLGNLAPLRRALKFNAEGLGTDRKPVQAAIANGASAVTLPPAPVTGLNTCFTFEPFAETSEIAHVLAAARRDYTRKILVELRAARIERRLPDFAWAKAWIADRCSRAKVMRGINEIFVGRGNRAVLQPRAATADTRNLAPTIYAAEDTFLKAQPVLAAELKDDPSQKCRMRKGTSKQIRAMTAAKGNWRIEFDGAYPGCKIRGVAYVSQSAVVSD